MTVAGDDGTAGVAPLAAGRRPWNVSGVRRRHLRRRLPPWRWVSAPTPAIPGMITTEEARYYRWIGRRHRGWGAVVELGCWLGRSTFCLLDGMRRRPGFGGSGRRLVVVDDFVWRSSWMDGYYDAGDRPANHESFRPLFDRYTAGLAADLDVRTARLSPYEGNEHIQPFAWDGEPVELLVVDCGRTFAVNQAWWDALAPSFAPGKTLIVMQDWQTFRELPHRPYNQTKDFTDAKGAALQLEHELRHGGVGTFRFVG